MVKKEAAQSAFRMFDSFKPMQEHLKIYETQLKKNRLIKSIPPLYLKKPHFSETRFEN
jgi:hypothetical protein